MADQGLTSRGRTFLAGRVISNFGQSSIDCVVRRVSDEGAVIELETVLGVPEHFHLLVKGEGPPTPCKRAWQSEKQVGLTFDQPNPTAARIHNPERRSADPMMRNQMLALRAALDEIEVGIVLLDANLRSLFINKSFRRMWSLPDEAADRGMAFVALMYHGRNTHAYAAAETELDEYVAERVRLVRIGETKPLDLRRSNGEVIRLQCAVLPDGGRMLSYTYVTDIVRHSDELETLKAALDNVQDGVVLLDANLQAQFLNRKIRRFWEVSEERAATHPSYESLIKSNRHALGPEIAEKDKESFFQQRIAEVKAGDPTPRDLLTPDGRHLRAHCTVLENGGRMITYWDISELVLKEKQLEKLASTDPLTGLFNRRRFFEAAEAEWGRFERYHRPLSVLMVDIDHFKIVNDRYGHAVGDSTLKSIGQACSERKRTSDIVGRIGGEEFAVLLPETDFERSVIVAERIRRRVEAKTFLAHKVHFKVTVSIGVATASLAMSGVEALMRSADEALYKAKADGRNRIVQWSSATAPKLAAE